MPQPGGLWIVDRMNPNKPGGFERFPQTFRTEASALSGVTGPVCQGRAFRAGKWLPWERISATVYENRKRWPRDGYEVRIATGHDWVAP